MNARRGKSLQLISLEALQLCECLFRGSSVWSKEELVHHHLEHHPLHHEDGTRMKKKEEEEGSMGDK